MKAETQAAWGSANMAEVWHRAEIRKNKHPLQ